MKGEKKEWEDKSVHADGGKTDIYGEEKNEWK